ncbi:MAG: PAS domain-containing protein [Pseudomonadota bacterium]
MTHPGLRQLLAFWDDRRGGDAMPTCAAIDAVALWHWLGNLMLIEATSAGEFKYRVYGTGLAEYYGRDLTGKTTAWLRPGVRELVCREYDAVCKTARPLLVTHRRRVREQPILVEKLILPFAGEGQTVARLLVGAYPSV